MSEKPSTRIKERQLIFMDLEFTGLEMRHEILQIAAIVVTQPDFKIVREWEAKTKPEHLDQADPESIKIVGYTDEKWKDAIPLRQALEEFNAIAKDGVLVGYNPVMDFLFLQKAMAGLGMKPAFHWQVVDVMSMVWKDLYGQPLTEYRMSEITKYFGIKNDKHHDALEDARMTYEIFMKLTEGLKV